MDSLLRRIEPYYTEVNEEIYKTRVDYRSWPLMREPLPIISIITFYLVFVLWLGPKYMAFRKPYTLKNTIIAYNFVQVLFSVIVFIMAINADGIKSVWNHALLRENRARLPVTVHVLRAEWWYLISKVTELLDTVFFILRKKDRQVTFLHVYHHASVCLSVWFLFRYLPGEQEIVIGLLNCVVHIFMYTYYLLSSMGPSFQKYLWWKKYMTQLQLVQFLLMMLYTTNTLLFSNNLLRIPSYVLLATALIFLTLFSKFYKTEYKKRKSI